MNTVTRQNSELKVRTVFANAFYQLLAVYTLFVVLISLGFFWKFTLHFEVFAVLLAILGGVALHGSEDGEKKIKNRAVHYSLIALGVVLILGFRIIPYISNSIPLGYDAGIYKYGIEAFAEKGFGVDSWVRGAMSPGFLYLLVPLLKLGISSEFILVWVFIFFCVLLGFSIYLASRAYFGNRTAVIALLLYAVSAIQFKVFTYMYYKNVIALACLFFALYFLERSQQEGKLFAPTCLPRTTNLHNKFADISQTTSKLNWNRIWFIVFGVLVGITHLPTFFIFGIAYILFILNNRKNFGKKFVDGFLVLVISLVGYIGFWREAILPLIVPVAESFVEPGTAPGTFVSFFSYQFATLAYLPFAILGLFYLVWNRKFNMLFFLTAITAIIVYFQFFFFNRFIIHLDIFLIVLASSGFALLIDNKKKVGTIILVLMLVSAGFVTLQEAKNAKPLIRADALDLIKMMDLTVEDDASVIALSSEYSPWVLAYSNRATIAPGLFEENKWSQEEWGRFWKTNNEDETKSMMSVYRKPVYLFAGTKSFNNSCFTDYLEKNGNKLLKYTCEND
jgi:hypothetical protein